MLHRLTCLSGTGKHYRMLCRRSVMRSVKARGLVRLRRRGLLGLGRFAVSAMTRGCCGFGIRPGLTLASYRGPPLLCGKDSQHNGPSRPS
jgi:hypothetical protein